MDDVPEYVRRRHSGYVLLTTLLLLVLVAAALTTACRVSLLQALAAQEAERSLQTRWGALSCQRVLLPDCEKILISEEKRTGEAVVSCRRSVILCGRKVDLIFGDEQAKINVGDLVRRNGKTDAAISLRQLLSGSGITASIRLRPADFGGAAASPHGLWLSSFGAVFDGIDPARLVIPRYGTRCPADLLTCWGDGRINWRRAGEKTMRQNLVPLLTYSQIGLLMALRKHLDNSRPIDLAGALDTCGLTGVQRAAAADRLCDGSSCHTLWIILAEGAKVTYRINVSQESVIPRQISGFEW